MFWRYNFSLWRNWSRQNYFCTFFYQSFRKSRQYAYNAKDYFLQASDLELDGNISTNDAVSEMRKLMEQIDDLFIPSIRETAKSAGIELE